MKDAAPHIAAGTVPKPGVPIGTHISAPVVLANGEVYGTLCCFSRDVKEDVSALDLKRLKYRAQLLSEELLDSGIGTEMELQPKSGAAPLALPKRPAGRFGGGDFRPTERAPKQSRFQDTERPDSPRTKR